VTDQFTMTFGGRVLPNKVFVVKYRPGRPSFGVRPV